MLTCKARGCLSNRNTKIDGREIAFFAFPEDDMRRNQWFRNSKLNLATSNDKESIHLCELHFEKTYFTATKELKINAIPTIFRSLQDSLRKRKTETILSIESLKVPPLKQKHLNEDSHSLVTPPQSPFTQLAENVEESITDNKTDMAMNNEVALNGSNATTSMLYKEMDINKNIYRLTIQIEKIRAKPGPRIKKLLTLMEAKREIENSSVRSNEALSIKDFKTQLVDQGLYENIFKDNKFNKKPPCIKGGCKLKKTIYRSKSAFQCEHCDKYYVMKKSNVQIQKANTCIICQKSFPTPQSLYLHVKKHFVCDMCRTECSSRMSYDKHARSHVSTDPLFPYKCHQCTEIFDSKDDVRSHYASVHPSLKHQYPGRTKTLSAASLLSHQPDYRCTSCNITFRNEQAYRNHVNSHKQKEGLRCNISESNNIISVPNPLTGGQIGILRAVKFSCRVCSKQFDNVAEVDKHTRTHLESAEGEHKCNICKKLLKTNALLNEHLKHHLSRAHPCPICPKAFINRTTLKIHLKTHGES